MFGSYDSSYNSTSDNDYIFPKSFLGNSRPVMASNSSNERESKITILFIQPKKKWISLVRA